MVVIEPGNHGSTSESESDLNVHLPAVVRPSPAYQSTSDPFFNDRIPSLSSRKNPDFLYMEKVNWIKVTRVLW